MWQSAFRCSSRLSDWFVIMRTHWKFHIPLCHLSQYLTTPACHYAYITSFLAKGRRSKISLAFHRARCSIKGLLKFMRSVSVSVVLSKSLRGMSRGAVQQRQPRGRISSLVIQIVFSKWSCNSIKVKCLVETAKWKRQGENDNNNKM